jgi:hypothetical protein
MVRKILKALYIIQEVSNKNRNPKLGKGFLEAKRLNPYNPLSYVLIIGAIITGILMFGFVGIRKEIDLQNPFKWN